VIPVFRLLADRIYFPDIKPQMLPDLLDLDLSLLRDVIGHMTIHATVRFAVGNFL